MKRMMKYHIATKLAIMMLCLAVFPIGVHGQGKQKEKTSNDKTVWSDKSLQNAGKHLGEMKGWQAAIDNLEKEKAKCDSLKNVAESQETTLANRKGQLNESQELLRKQFGDTRERGRFKQLYAKYDTVFLLQVKGHLGDEPSEKTIDELLACHRAEVLLSVPYDSVRVANAVGQLGGMEKEGKDGLNSDLADRLKHYEEKTLMMKEVLIEADSIIGKSEKNQSPFLAEQDRRKFLKEVESKLDLSQFGPQEYPYLYGVLMEALDTKMDDPSNDIEKIIGKL